MSNVDGAIKRQIVLRKEKRSLSIKVDAQRRQLVSSWFRDPISKMIMFFQKKEKKKIVKLAFLSH